MAKERSNGKTTIELDSIHRQIIDIASKINSDWNKRGLLQSSYPSQEIAKACPELLKELVVKYYQSTCMGPFITKDVKKFIANECKKIKDMVSSGATASNSAEKLCQDVDNACSIQISEIDRLRRRSIARKVFNIATLLFSAIAALGTILTLIQR